MRIFLGGSTEASDAGLLLEVASWVEKYGHRPLRWDEPGAFPAGTYTFAALRELARNVDGAIFIFSEDDHVWYRTDKLTQPRDNVLLEYGLFSDALGEHRIAICQCGSPRTATDLLGITRIYITEGTMVRAEAQVAAWLRRISVPDPSTVLMEHLRSPFQSSGKRSLFLKGTELVRGARRRLALVAKTPIILIGPRPYDGSSAPISYEIDQYRAYWDAITRSAAGGSPEFLCVASRPCMLDEISAYGHTSLPQQVKERYIDLDRKSARSMRGSRVSFVWQENSAPMTFLVSDDDFMIWFKDGSGESVWITANNEVVAGALYSQAYSIAKGVNTGDFLSDLEELGRDA